MTQKLNGKILIEFNEWKKEIFICFLLSVLAYGGLIVNVTYATDDYNYIFSDVDNTAQGRWFSDFLYNDLFQKCFMPTLAPLVSISCFLLTGIGLCKLWQIKKYSRLFLLCLWCLHPYLLGTYNFRVATINYSLGYLMAISGLLLVGKKRRVSILSGILLFYLALSTYQPVLGFILAAVMVQILLMSFRENFSAESIRDSAKLFLRYILILGLSVVVYLVVTKLIFILFNVDVNPRLQAGFISDFDQFKAKIAVLVSVLFVRLGPIKEFVLPFIGKLAIFIIYLCAILAVIKRGSKFSGALIALLWLALIPLGAILFLLPLEALSVPWRVCMGLVVFFVGMFAMTQESDSKIIRRTGLTIGGFLIVYFILNNNTVLYKQYLTNQRDLFMGNQIITRIQSLDGYRPEMELAIIGKVQEETFSKEGKGNLEIIHEYIKHCSIRRYSLATSAFEKDWSKYSFLLNYMNLELKRCGAEKVNRLRKLAAARKPWPDRSSVFIEDGTAVLILSENNE